VSPLTAYIYRCLGHVGTQVAITDCLRMLRGELSAVAFLHTLQPAMLRSVTDGCARIALSRKAGLLAIRASLAA
jgi:hypothetical protein